MKWIKRLVQEVVLLVAFIIIAMLGVAVLVDPNDYRDEIATLVQQQTGRELVMEGDLGLSVFPWLGLELNKVRLNNPPGFTDEVFAAVERVNIKVALWPLLRLETRVGNLELDGLTVNLERRADGKTNWDDLGPVADATTPPTPEQQKQSQPDAAPEKPVVPEFYVGSLDITHTNVSWRDATSKVYTRIEDLSFSTGEVLPFKLIPFKLELSVRNDSPKLLAGIHLKGGVYLDLPTEKYTLENLDFDLQAAGTVVPGGNQTLKLQAPKITAALKEQNVTLEQMKLQIAGLETTIDAQLKSYETSPEVSGRLTAQVAQLRGLMQAFDIEPPVTADPNVLGSLQAGFDFTHDDKSVELKNLKLVLDDTTVTGALTMRDFTAPRYQLNLSADTLNADRYLPPPEPEPAKETETESSGDDRVTLPMDDLRALRAEGSLKFGELRMMKLKLTNLNAGLNSAGDGIVRLEPLSVDMYSGNFNGSVILDVTGNVPVYKVSSELSQVQVEPLLVDYMQSHFISGRMGGKVDITTSGNRIRHFKKNLNGTAALSFRDGALSVDLREKAREAKAKLKREPYKAPPQKPTTFSAIKAGLDFNQGVASNKDLEVRAGHINITGEGEYALPKDTIDYTFTLLFTEDPTDQDAALKDVYDLPIKMHLKGKLAKLDYMDIVKSGMSGAVKAKAKQEVEKKKDEAKDKAIDDLKDKLKKKFKL